MGWKAVQTAYLERDQNLEGKNTEDLLARRVLDGMGFKTKHVNLLELKLCGQVHADDPLWQRTERLFVRALQCCGGSARNLVDGWTIIAQETDPQHKSVFERMDLLKDMQTVPEYFPLIFARVKDTVIGLAFVYWQTSALSELKPPYKVVDCLRTGDYDGRLIVQEIPLFVRSLAEYDKLITKEDA